MLKAANKLPFPCTSPFCSEFPVASGQVFPRTAESYGVWACVAFVVAAFFWGGGCATREKAGSQELQAGEALRTAKAANLSIAEVFEGLLGGSTPEAAWSKP